MFRRGIGVEGVVSQIGALSKGGAFIVNRERILTSLCQRFGASEEEAEFSIKRSLEVGVVEEVGLDLRLKTEE